MSAVRGFLNGVRFSLITFVQSELGSLRVGWFLGDTKSQDARVQVKCTLSLPEFYPDKACFFLEVGSSLTLCYSRDLYKTVDNF